MDFGLDGLLDKCELYFGKGITKLAVGILLLAALCIALNYIVSDFLYPLFIFINNVTTHLPPPPVVTRNILAGFATGIVGAVVAKIGHYIAYRQYRQTMKQQKLAIDSQREAIITQRRLLEEKHNEYERIKAENDQVAKAVHELWLTTVGRDKGGNEDEEIKKTDTDK